MVDFNDIGVFFVQRVKDNFKDFAIVQNNVRDLNVEYEYNDKSHTHVWSVWIQLKHSPVDSCLEFETVISMTDLEFSKTKFKTVEEVETVIAEAIKDYVYGV